jgi:pimeloyl-ACP methyl ester carboxylesterase
VPSLYRDAYSRVRNSVLRPGPDPTYADGDDATWMDVDWPALSRRVEVDGRGVNVIDGGDMSPPAPPLLFLHGLGGVWQNWLLNLPPFMGSHRVVALDLPGFGQSEMPAGELSIPALAHTVDAVCRELGLEDPVVVGNSMGGFVGAEMAVSFPTRVSKLVLVSAAGLSTEHLVREPLLVGARMWTLLTSHGGVRAEIAVTRPRLRRAALQFIVRYPERLSVPLALEIVRGSGSPGFIRAFDALMRHSIRESLERIEVPVLVVGGRNDVLVPVEDAETYEHLIGENAHSVIFDDTGHLPMLERPSRFNELLSGFIAGEREPERGVEGVSA